MTSSTSRLRRHLAPVLVAGVLLAACGTEDGAGAESTAPATDETTPDEAMSEGMTEGNTMSEENMSEENMSEGEMMSEDHEATSEGAVETEASGSAAPDVTATLADGSTITLADYAGEQVFVETFATWCSNCRRQLGDTAAAAAAAGDTAEFLALSVETNLDPAELDAYAAENGFTDVTFAVLDDASLATLADTFGNAVLVPPSTPKFTVAADGTVGELATGFESVDEILAQVGGDA